MKEEILQKALPLFLKHGIREMSNQKLVELLGISTKTVYQYFKNKEELLEEALNLFHNQWYQTLEALPADQNTACQFFDLWLAGVEMEYKVNKAFFQDLHYYYPELANKVERAIGKKFTRQFLQIIQRGVEEGTFRRNIMPEVVLEGVFVLYTALVRTERFKRFRLSSFDALLNTIAIHIRGFCTGTGMQSLDEHIASLGISAKRNSSKEKALATANGLTPAKTMI